MAVVRWAASQEAMPVAFWKLVSDPKHVWAALEAFGAGDDFPVRALYGDLGREDDIETPPRAPRRQRRVVESDDDEGWKMPLETNPIVGFQPKKMTEEQRNDLDRGVLRSPDGLFYIIWGYNQLRGDFNYIRVWTSEQLMEMDQNLPGLPYDRLYPDPRFQHPSSMSWKHIHNNRWRG